MRVGVTSPGLQFDLPAAEPVRIPAGDALLDGDLARPRDARGLVVFSHGSGSGRRSPRNRMVAARLGDAGLATLLFDLLSPDEQAADERTAHLRFDIALLAQRLVGAIDWLGVQAPLRELGVGLFGASTGAAAAMVAAAKRPAQVQAVVSRGGRPDLASYALAHVRSPVRLIVGGTDTEVLALNRLAFAELATADKELLTVPRASHLFVEPGALDVVARLAAEWFARHLRPRPGVGSL